MQEEDDDDLLLEAIQQFNDNDDTKKITRAHVKHIYREMCMKQIRLKMMEMKALQK